MNQSTATATVPEPSKNALIHHPEFSLANAEQIVSEAKADGWVPFEIDGERGVYVAPKYGVPAGDFARILLCFGDNWVMCKDPRFSAQLSE
jgi:hypothetical protein